MELGIVLDLSGSSADPEGLVALAQRAETGGLDAVVVRAGDDGLDPWTTAVFIAGRTKHIQIGVLAPPGPPLAPPGPPLAPPGPPLAPPGSAPGSPTSPASSPTSPPGSPTAGPAELTDTDGPYPAEVPFPAVVDKARHSLDILAGTRFITSDSAWVSAPAQAGPDELREHAQTGRPVVVPVSTAAEVDRLIALAGDRGTSNRPRRSAAARARRRPGIDYDGVPESLADVTIEPGDPAYRGVASTYLRGGSPGLVLRPRTAEQVADALAFARRHRTVPLGLRSGGHGISGRSTNDGGIVIDVGAMNTIEVLDRDRRLVRIGPGATWKQVAAALDPYGWALGSGDYGGVGVGGLATAGGIGYLSRQHGLTIDHIQAVDLVLADGRLVRASRDENPDLFWAVRGAGANFGVATAFEFVVDEVREVGFAMLTLVSADVEQSLRSYGRIAATAPRDTTAFLVTGRPQRGQWVLQLYAMVDSPDPDVIVERITPFTELGLLAQQQVVLARYTDVMNLAADIGPDGHQGVGQPASRSAFLPELSDAFARDAAHLLRSGQVYFFQLRAMGGAIADVAPDETAFSHRTVAFQATGMGADQGALNDAWDRLAHHFDGLYLSFDTDLRPQRLRDAFPPPVLTRLVELKRRYDPENLFRDNFNIDPRLDPTADLAAATAHQEE